MTWIVCFGCLITKDYNPGYISNRNRLTVTRRENRQKSRPAPYTCTKNSLSKSRSGTKIFESKSRSGTKIFESKSRSGTKIFESCVFAQKKMYVKNSVEWHPQRGCLIFLQRRMGSLWFVWTQKGPGCIRSLICKDSQNVAITSRCLENLNL